MSDTPFKVDQLKCCRFDENAKDYQILAIIDHDGTLTINANREEIEKWGKAHYTTQPIAILLLRIIDLESELSAVKALNPDHTNQ